MIRSEYILEQVKAEMDRQDGGYKEKNYSMVEWVALLTKEVGEVAKQVIDYHDGMNVKQKQEGVVISNEAVQKERLMSYRMKLIQLGAISIQAIKCLYVNSINDEVKI